MARQRKTKQETIVEPIINKEETPVKETPVKKKYNGNSIIEALKFEGVDSSYASRQTIWKNNNLKSVQGMDYLGLGQQNLIMVNLYKDGKLAL